MRMALVISREELNQMSYPVVVEGWDHAAGRHAAGRQKRAFQAEFDEKERRKARQIYNTFFRWYLRTGTPERLVILIDERSINDAQENGDELPSECLWPMPNIPRTQTWTIETWHLAKRLINFFGTI